MKKVYYSYEDCIEDCRVLIPQIGIQYPAHEATPNLIARIPPAHNGDQWAGGDLEIESLISKPSFQGILYFAIWPNS